jgi:transaldolase
MMPAENLPPLQRLSALGQSVWVDYLSRESIRGGHLQELIDDYAVVGATSNPTIFEKAMTSGASAYDEQLNELAEQGLGVTETFWALAEQDIREACDVFRPVWDGGNGRDGYVSLEVDPRLAFETLETYREAMRLHEEVNRPNLLVKIPATKPGLASIEDVIAKGRSVNITLIFSLRRYAEVVECYLRGLERLVAEELKGKLAVANAKLAYRHYRETFAGERWEFLASKGATPQRVLWASTSTKNPAYPDTKYVEELIGPETINTMPEETIMAYQDHGNPEPRLERGLDEAQRVFDELAAAGVDYDDVTETLEREGVEKFAASFEQLIQSLKEKREQLSAVGAR